MLGLSFDLIGLAIVLIGTLIQYRLDYFMRNSPAELQKRWARILAVLTCVVIVVTGFGFWQTHVEDRERLDRVEWAAVEREIAAQERDQQAQKERQTISFETYKIS